MEKSGERRDCGGASEHNCLHYVCLHNASGSSIQDPTQKPLVDVQGCPRTFPAALPRASSSLDNQGTTVHTHTMPHGPEPTSAPDSWTNRAPPHTHRHWATPSQACWALPAGTSGTVHAHPSSNQSAKTIHNP